MAHLGGLTFVTMRRLQQNDLIFKLLLDNVPPQPYASDYPVQNGLYRTSKRNALECDLIQLNGSNRLGVIVLDIDYDISLAVDLQSLPLPNLVMVNPRNRHCHIGYVLSNPVPLNDDTPKARRTLIRIVQDGLTAMWEADKGYAHLISKNPFSDRWLTYVMRLEPYTLAELREYVDDDIAEDIATPWKKAKAIGEGKKIAGMPVAEFRELGRNCRLFEDLRHWAYSQLHNYFKQPERFYKAVLLHGHELNTEDLPTEEVESIAKSISRWTYENLSPQDYEVKKVAWNKITTKKSIEARKKKKEDRLEAFERLYVPEETSIQQVCEIMGISLRTGKTYWKEIQARKQAEQPSLPGLEA